MDTRTNTNTDIEVGISVSVESSPRVGSGSGCEIPGAPIKYSKTRFVEWNMPITILDSDDEGEGEGPGVGDEDDDVQILNLESVSPRPRSIARRLSFSISPIPLLEPSVSIEYMRRSEPTATWTEASRSATTTATVIPDPADQADQADQADPMMIGECGVCYALLPERANHVFTLCGHLFCVKCFLMWWDTSSTCPMCRAELLVADVADASADNGMNAGDGGSDSGDEMRYDDEDDDDAMDEGEEGEDEPRTTTTNTNEVPPGTTAIDRYLHLDSGIQWSSEPDMDDDIIQLTRHEIESLRENRILATSLYTRRRFAEMLFSPIQHLSIRDSISYSPIPKQQWVGLSENEMGPSNMYEFVTRRFANQSMYETNMFGYIKRIIIMNLDSVWAQQNRRRGGGGANNDDEDYDWENRHEYAFIVDVFAPSGPSYRYNLDDGTFETREIILTFTDIRRMYSIDMWVLTSIEDTVDV